MSIFFADNRGFELHEHSMSNRDPYLDPGCNHITQNNWPPGEAAATGGCSVPDDVKGILITTYFIQAGLEKNQWLINQYRKSNIIDDTATTN